ncbi:MAG: hypothetical protein WB421_11175 [Terriglobales bacterium]
MKQVLALVLSCAIVSSAFAAPAPQGDSSAATPTTPPKKMAHKAVAPSVSKQLDELKNEMKQAIDAQQQQIQQLRQELQTRDQAVQQLQQRLDQSQAVATEAQGKADSAATQVTQQQQAVTELKSDVADIKQNSTNTALSLQETQKNITDALESPVALHFKGITVTPVGFMAAETVWRQKALASDVNTPFNSVPFGGSSQSDLSEFFGSGRQSRVGMLAEGKLKNAKLSGYVEADFLSAGVTSNNNQSNSYTLRQRQVWGQAALTDGWSFTGGQMWSLVTETKNGVDNRSEALPMVIDAQYTAGFSWARQFGFRVAKDFGDKFWLAFSVENPQATLTAHGTTNNFVLGAAGTSGGLYNAFNGTYSFNPSPDFVVKAVFQPTKSAHMEVFGMVNQFRDRIFPCAAASTTVPCDGATSPSAIGAFNASTTGGGLGANLRVNLLNNHVTAGIHFLGGNGIGRYGTVGLSDATARPDGHLALLRSYQALETLEYHAKKFDIYSNVGGEYAGRNAVLNAAGTGGVGYGSPLFSNSGCATETLPTGSFVPGAVGSCTGDTRNLIEGTIGFWYRFYKGPKGTIQWGPQFSYIVRNTWYGANGIQPHADEPMVLTSFRYYLP